jgi:hypothetical protein
VGAYSVKTRQLSSARPDFTFGGCGSNCYALGPYDFATIYDVLSLWTAATPITGAGQTIAIVGRTNINTDDATTFWNLFGLGKNGVPTPTLKVTLNGPDPGITDPNDEAEADIDTQWSGAVAPGATIDLVVSESTETDDGVDLSALYIVDNNLAPIMSESFGTCEADMAVDGTIYFYGALWEQAAAQGISAMVSTGDDGSATAGYVGSSNCDDPTTTGSFPSEFGLAVNGIASSPFNVAVGGTDFNQYNKWSTYWKPASQDNATTQESAIGYIPEMTWNDSCTNTIFLQQIGGSSNAEANCNNNEFSGYVDTVGGGGGQSLFWVGFKPSWQTGTGVPNDNTRDLPDVSLFASDGFQGSFYLICQSDQSTSGSCDTTSPTSDLQGYGGTSVASPAFAGVMALVNQKMGEAQGNPNYVLYDLPAKQANVFHDIATGSTIAMPCLKGTTNCVTNTGGDQLGVLSGWGTTTGYDLATGLGSVDVANLVNNWNKVTFTPTTTALTLSVPANTVHGALIPVTIAVTPSPGSGTHTQAEDVSLVISPGTPGSTPPNPGIDWNTLSNGTISWQSTMLPGGTYKVVAHYEGDGTYGGSYSTPSASITIKPEASFVYMPGVVTPNGSANSVVYGTGEFIAYLLRADVQNSQQNFCSPPAFGNAPLNIACPTGTITFTDNGKTLDASPYKLNSEGYTEDQTIELTGGNHTLAATYSGDASYQPSSISGISVTVTKAPTFILNVSAPATANAGQQFTVAALVTTQSAGVAPTGSVSFFSTLTGGSPVQLPGTVTLTPTNGNASTGTAAALSAGLSTSIGTAGTYKITATYSGDANYQAVTAGQSNSAPITITASTSGFTLSANPTSVAITPGGAAGTSVITVADQGGFTGNVTLAVSAGLPSGVTAQFTPNPTATTSTLSLLANSSATTGPATLTITGTSGSLNATTTIALTVNQTFTVPATLTAPAAANPGQSTTTTMSVATAGNANFTNNVTFSACSGLPTGATCSFSPTQINAGATSPKTVTITVQTAGPFTGVAGDARLAGTRRAALGPKPRLWLPLSLPLAGMLLVGLAGRRLPRSYKVAALCLALALAGLLIACGGGGSSPPPPVTVTVSPSAVSTLFPSLAGAPAQTQQFTATVTNTTSQTVTWAVTGGSGNGTIDQTGLYTAPATLPSPAAVTITATSSAATSPGTATVNLQTPTPAGTYPITLTVTEGSLTNPTGFSLTVN